MTGSRFRTVIADDLPEMRRLLKRVVERGGRFEVIGEAGNGLEAIVAVREQQPDLLLLDISMPVCDGLEALPQVRASSPRTVVAMVSGFEAGRLESTARKLGASAYLEKGMQPDEIVDVLLAVMEEQQDPPDTETGSPAS